MADEKKFGVKGEKSVCTIGWVLDSGNTWYRYTSS